MADPVDSGTDAAVADYDARIRDGASPSAAASAAVKAGAAVAGTAACAATGAGAVISPLCGLAAGALAEGIASVADDVGDWVSGIFGGGDKPKPIRFTAADLAGARLDPDQLTWSGVYTSLRAHQCAARAELEAVGRRISSELGRLLGVSMTGPEAGIAALRDDGLPLVDSSWWRTDPDLGDFAFSCPVGSLQGDGTFRLTGEEPQAWHYDFTAPDFFAQYTRAATDTIPKTGVPKTGAGSWSAQTKILRDGIAAIDRWLDDLGVTAGRVAVGLGTRAALLRAMSTAPRSGPTLLAAPELTQAQKDLRALAQLSPEDAEALRLYIQAQRGVTSGVQFLLPRAAS